MTDPLTTQEKRMLRMWAHTPSTVAIHGDLTIAPRGLYGEKREQAHVWEPINGRTRLRPKDVTIVPTWAAVTIARQALSEERDLSPGVAWLISAADVVAAHVARTGFAPAAVAHGRTIEPIVELASGVETTALLDRLAASVPVDFIAGHQLQLDAREWVQHLSVRLAAASVRAAATARGLAPLAPFRPATAHLLLASLRGEEHPDLKPDWTFAAKPTSSRVLEDMDSWLTPLEPGEKTWLELTLLVPDVDLDPGAWRVHVWGRDAAAPADRIQPDVEHREVWDTLIADMNALWPWSRANPMGEFNDSVGFLLPEDEVADFIMNVAPGLMNAGMHVNVPAWMRRPAKTTIVVGASRAAATGLFGLEQLLEVEVRVEVNGQQLDEDAARTAARTGVVNVPGQEQVFLDGAVLERLRALFEASDDGLTARDLLALRDEADERAVREGDACGVILTGNDAWVAALTNADPGAGDGVALEPLEPANVAAELRSYQREGLDWLNWLTTSGFGGVLADEMGLGKTLQVLALIQAEQEGLTGLPVEVDGPTLVVVKPSGLEPWLLQPARFTPDLVVERFHSGLDLDEAREGCDILLVTYDTLRLNAAEFADRPWKRVVLDEATKVKNAKSSVTRAVASLDSAQTLVLSGTPVENSLSDLHTLVSLANPGLLGTPAEFNRTYGAAIGGVAQALSVRAGEVSEHDVERREQTLERLKRAYGPFYMARKKADHVEELNMGTKHINVVECGLTQAQVDLYRRMQAEAMERIENKESQASAETLRLMTKLQQVVNHPSLVTGEPAHAVDSGKMVVLDRLLAGTSAAGEKALVFTRFAKVASLLRRHLEETSDARVFTLTGAVPTNQRLADIAEFQAHEGPAVYVITIGAGAEAIDLSTASHVIHFDRWWNPAREAQANDRAYRPGQTGDVSVHILQCVGTLEQNVHACLEGKTLLAAAATAETPPAAQFMAMTPAELLEATALDDYIAA